MSSPSRTSTLEPDGVQVLELVHQLDVLRSERVVQFAHDLLLIREEHDSLAGDLPGRYRRAEGTRPPGDRQAGGPPGQPGQEAVPGDRPAAHAVAHVAAVLARDGSANVLGPREAALEFKTALDGVWRRYAAADPELH